MHITQVINNLGTGGAENLVVNLAHEILLAGHESRLVLLAGGDGVPQSKARELGLDVVTLGASARDLRATQALAKLSTETDVIHAHLFPSFYFAAFGKIDAPRLYTEHSSTNRRRGRRLYYPFERRAYEKYDRLLAVSRGVQESLELHLDRLGVAKDVGVIQNGISSEFFDTPVARDNRGVGPMRLLAVGTLDYRKNFAAAIMAVERTQGVSLTIVGNGPDEAALRALISSKGLDARVELRPATSQVRRAMDEHDALLSSSRYEGFGLVVAEALSRGLPIIGPNVPGLAEVVEDGVTGVLYGAGSVSEMSSAIEFLRDDSSAYWSFSRGALEGRDRFRMRGVASKYIQEYGAVLR